jgi:hypothetical protein
MKTRTLYSALSFLAAISVTCQADFTVGNADETQFSTYPLNYENVNVNTSTLNANNTQIDTSWDSGKSGFGDANFAIGTFYSHDQSFNIPQGYRIRSIDWTFQATTSDGAIANWFPALTQGGAILPGRQCLRQSVQWQRPDQRLGPIESGI